MNWCRRCAGVDRVCTSAIAAPYPVGSCSFDRALGASADVMRCNVMPCDAMRCAILVYGGVLWVLGAGRIIAAVRCSNNLLLVVLLVVLLLMVMVIVLLPRLWVERGLLPEAAPAGAGGADDIVKRVLRCGVEFCHREKGVTRGSSRSEGIRRGGQFPVQRNETRYGPRVQRLGKSLLVAAVYWWLRLLLRLRLLHRAPPFSHSARIRIRIRTRIGSFSVPPLVSSEFKHKGELREGHPVDEEFDSAKPALYRSAAAAAALRVVVAATAVAVAVVDLSLVEKGPRAVRHYRQASVRTGHGRFPRPLPAAPVKGRLLHGKGRFLGPVHLVPVAQDKLLSRGQAPDKDDLVLLPAAVAPRAAPFQGLRAGESEPPADPPLRSGKHPALLGGLAIDLVAAASVPGRVVASGRLRAVHGRHLARVGMEWNRIEWNRAGGACWPAPALVHRGCRGGRIETKGKGTNQSHSFILAQSPSRPVHEPVPNAGTLPRPGRPRQRPTLPDEISEPSYLSYGTGYGHAREPRSVSTHTQTDSVRPSLGGGARLAVRVQLSGVAHGVRQGGLALGLRRSGFVHRDVSSARVPTLSVRRVQFHGRVGGLFVLVLGPGFLEFPSQPVVGNGEHLRGMVFPLEFLVFFQFAHLSLPAAPALVVQVEQVGRPVVEAVKDVRRVQNSGAPLVALLDEPLEQVLSDADVEAGGDFVEEQDLKGPDQAQHDLDPAALPVRELVHVPVQIDSEHADQLVAALGVRVLELLLPTQTNT
ncbi:unnamed protein product [Pseudo-nitzschia multistriata]|uniref:Uncharacterized protein n=1 Tax=Pseudo-nitzschia multistriata TaxID=183589 RepID=A0A448ZD04_9STRA|nr:unnamed protein product [Pseudo-nitzschia multistriata]